MITETRWRYPSEGAEGKARELAGVLGVPEVFALLLVSRGLFSESACRVFLEPSLSDLHDPWQLKDLSAAVGRIAKAVRSGERILILGDYDVDGVTSTFLIADLLKRLGARVGFYVPNRLKEGYGFTAKTVEEALRKGVSLIVTVDCGTSSVEETTLAKSKNIDVVVTDHHALQPSRPDVYAFVNPRREDCDYPFKELAGVGVVLKLLQALVGEFGLAAPDQVVRENLDVVALGTIADVVPLAGENRILAKLGIEELRKSTRPGLVALRQISRLADKRLEASDVSFVLAPRINAAGRLGNPESAVRLLMAADAQEATAIAESLEEDNTLRKKMDGEALREALEMLDRQEEDGRSALVLSSRSWHPGIIGIVAARLVERFGRPAALISVEGDKGRGSARAVPGLDLCEILEDCRESLITYGGHSYAAGFSIQTENIDGFTEMFKKAVGVRMEGLDLEPEVKVDGLITLKDCTASFVELLDRASPFGLGNPEPVLAVENAHLVSAPISFGKNHVRMIVAQGEHSAECVGFNMGHLLGELTHRGDHLSLAFTPVLNTWRGASKLQLKIKDVKFL
jgi:single-stranded-DNA-specific exonuclease